MTNQNVIPNLKLNKGKKLVKKGLIFGVILSLLITMLFVGCSKDDDNGADIDKNNPIGKTIMVYMVGSDLESENGKYATKDLKEMAKANVNTEKNNVLVCTGGAAEWHNDYVTADETAIIKLTDDTFEKIESYPIKNMGESSTLSEFITYSMTNYPNDQYALILWNHGGGPLFGYGEDEINEDTLTMQELEKSMKDANLGGENKLELIGFDACLMGSLETAWFLNDYANYFVGSEEVEPGCGWDYSFLKDVEYYQNGKGVATSIIDSYFDACTKKFKLFGGIDLTLSCLDLSKVEKTVECLDSLFADANSDLVNGDFNEFAKKRYETKTFDVSEDGFSLDIVDLNHMVTLLEDKYPEKVKALKDSVAELVCYSKTNVENASGVSIWYPSTSTLNYGEGLAVLLSERYRESDFANCKTAMEYNLKVYKDFDFAENYTKYLYNFMNMMAGVSPEDIPSYDGEMVVGSGNTVYLPLTAEEIAAIAGVQYTVLYKIPAEDSLSGKDEYIPVFCDIGCNVDENGNLFVKYGDCQYFVVDEGTGSDAGIPLSIGYYCDGSEYLNYYVDAKFASYSDDGHAEYKDVIWTLDLTEKGAEFGCAKPVCEEEVDILPQKEVVNPDDYDEYNLYYTSYSIVTDESGNAYFASNDGVYVNRISKKAGYHIECRGIEDMENYYIVFNIVDIYGISHISAPTSLA